MDLRDDLDSIIDEALAAESPEDVKAACADLRRGLAMRCFTVESVIRSGIETLQGRADFFVLENLGAVVDNLSNRTLAKAVLRELWQWTTKTDLSSSPLTEMRLMEVILRTCRGLAAEKCSEGGFVFSCRLDEEYSSRWEAGAMLVALAASGYSAELLQDALETLTDTGDPFRWWKRQLIVFPLAMAGQVLTPEGSELIRRMLAHLSPAAVADCLEDACRRLRQASFEENRAASGGFSRSLCFLAASAWSIAESLEGRKLSGSEAEGLLRAVGGLHALSIDAERLNLDGYFGEYRPLRYIFTDVLARFERILKDYADTSRLASALRCAVDRHIDYAFMLSEYMPEWYTIAFSSHMRLCMELGERISSDPAYTIKRVYEKLWGPDPACASQSVEPRKKRFLEFLVHFSKERPELIRLHGEELVRMDGPVAEGACAFLEKALQVV